MWFLKGNEHAASDVTTQQWSKYAHIKNYAKCNFIFKHEKGGMPIHVMHKNPFIFKCQCNPSYMKSWTLISSKKT